MGGAENAERVRRYFEKWKTEGLDAFLDMLPGDVEWHPYAARGRKIWGSDELRSFWDGFGEGAEVDADLHDVEPLDDDNVLATGTIHIRNGDETVSEDIAWLYSFRDGRLWRASGHASVEEAREAARFLHTDRVALSRTGPNFDVTLREEPRGRTVLELKGELDLGTVDELTAAIGRAAQSGHVLVDLRGLEFIDSSGLRTLLEAARDARERGWRLELRRGAQTVQRVIAMAGAERLLPFEEH